MVLLTGFCFKRGQHHWNISNGKTQTVTILNNNKKNFLSATSSWKRVLKRFIMTINALKKTREMTIMNYSQREYVQHVAILYPFFGLTSKKWSRYFTSSSLEPLTHIPTSPIYTHHSHIHPPLQPLHTYTHQSHIHPSLQPHNTYTHTPAT